MSDDHQCRRHERMFAIQGVVYYVAVTNDGDVIGFCSGGPSRRPAYAAQSEIYAIYLMTGFEQRGIGRRLFEHFRYCRNRPKRTFPDGPVRQSQSIILH
jgi:L-amino acid N-acyltransferase YncA